MYWTGLQRNSFTNCLITRKCIGHGYNARALLTA